MDVAFSPSIAYGALTVPPSKSLTHRYLICAALAGGESRIENPAAGADIEATRRCLAADSAVLDCGESGSTLRFLLPLCLLSGRDHYLTGSRRLLERPLNVYETICRRQGLVFENDGRRLHVRGPLEPGSFTLPGNISSQFVTGLLLALPLAAADSSLTVLPPVESRPYIDLTRAAMARFGVRAEQMPQADGGLVFRIPGGQRYRPCALRVEGDETLAACFAAFGLLGRGVTLEGLNPATLQGDRVFRTFFRALQEGRPTLDLADCPDLAPVLFVLAELLNGAEFTGTGRLRYKESDRLAVMEEELEKYRRWQRLPADARGLLRLEGHNDHRVVMALSLLLSRCGGILSGAEAVQKSCPGFFDLLRQLHIACI